MLQAFVEAPNRQLSTSAPRFAAPNEQTVLSTEDVVRGTISITGQIPMGLVGEIRAKVVTALSKLILVAEPQIHMSVTGNFEVEPASGAYIPMQNVDFVYAMLPRIGGGQACADRIVSAGGARFMTILINV